MFSVNATAQSVDEDQLGAWYMYFYNAKLGDGPVGMQGDFQYRNWNLGGDLEQLLLRSGLTYLEKNSNVLFTLGYANITTGTPGESTETVVENRIYQEALIPQSLTSAVKLTHRFRYEQRWLPEQDMRTRYRYNLFLNILLNDSSFNKGTIYIALYNELFINGQREIGSGQTVPFFDRNRTYLGLGYGILNSLRTQIGWMRQTTNGWAKDQLQVSLHHSF